MATDEEFERWFPPSYSGTLCIVTGFHQSGRRWMISDGDRYHGPEHDAWWNAGLITHNNGMDIETVRCVTGGGGIHRWFWLPEGVIIPNFTNKIVHTDGRELGGQGVTCPSRHDSGGYYGFEPGYGPHEMKLATMPMWLVERHLEAAHKAGATITGKTLSSPPSTLPSSTIDGSVDDGREALMTKCVWGALTDLRQLHHTVPSDFFMSELLRAYERYENQVTPRDRDRTHGTKSERLDKENRGYNLFVEKWRKGLAQWDTKLAAHASNPSTPARHPERDDEDYGASQVHDNAPSGKAHDNAPDPDIQFADPFTETVAPIFPLDILPPKIRAFTQQVALATGGDVSVIAFTLLTAASGAISHEFTLRMPGGYLVRPRLWQVIVGDPSSLKTPIMNIALRPLAQMDTESTREHAREMARWRELPKDERGPEPSQPLRYLVEDATVERIHEICAQQTRGVMVLIDEMTKFSDSGKASRGGLSDPDKSFYTRMYNGERAVVDRITRGHLCADPLSGSMLGGIQPDALHGLDHMNENGMMQRLTPTWAGRRRHMVDVDYAMEAQYWEHTIRRLASLYPCEMRLTPQASADLLEFGNFCVDVVTLTDVSKNLSGAIGKLNGLVGSISLILHFLWGADSAGRVDEQTTAMAIRLCREYVIPSNQLFYELSEGGKANSVMNKLQLWLLASDLPRVTPRDLTVNLKAMRGKTHGELCAVMSQLVSMGWVREEMEPSGHKVRAWLVHKRLRAQFAERRALELQRRVQTYRMLDDMKAGKRGGERDRLPDDPITEEDFG